MSASRITLPAAFVVVPYYERQSGLFTSFEAHRHTCAMNPLLAMMDPVRAIW